MGAAQGQAPERTAGESGRVQGPLREVSAPVGREVQGAEGGFYRSQPSRERGRGDGRLNIIILQQIKEARLAL